MKDKRYANRGKQLEQLIDRTNDEYRKNGIADIRKVPTPFKPLRLKGSLVTGHFMKADWVDYVGVYNGKAICLEAKQTKGKNFPLKNIHDQQLDFLESWFNKGAETFVVVGFTDYEKYYLLPFFNLREAFHRQFEGGRKSISLDEMQSWAYEIPLGSEYKLNFLEFI